jgi:hypothetical protein
MGPSTMCPALWTTTSSPPGLLEDPDDGRVDRRLAGDVELDDAQVHGWFARIAAGVDGVPGVDDGSHGYGAAAAGGAGHDDVLDMGSSW